MTENTPGKIDAILMYLEKSGMARGDGSQLNLENPNDLFRKPEETLAAEYTSIKDVQFLFPETVIQQDEIVDVLFRANQDNIDRSMFRPLHITIAEGDETKQPVKIEFNKKIEDGTRYEYTAAALIGNKQVNVLPAIIKYMIQQYTKEELEEMKQNSPDGITVEEVDYIVSIPVAKYFPTLGWYMPVPRNLDPNKIRDLMILSKNDYLRYIPVDHDYSEMYIDNVDKYDQDGE